MSKLRLFTRLQRTNRERIKNDEYRTRVMYERTNDRIQDSGNRQGYCDKSKVDCECRLRVGILDSAFNDMTQKNKQEVEYWVLFPIILLLAYFCLLFYDEIR